MTWLEQQTWANVVTSAVIVAAVILAVVWVTLATVIRILPLRRETPPHADCPVCAVGDRAHDG